MAKLMTAVQNLAQLQARTHKQVDFTFDEFKPNGEEKISSYFERFTLQLKLRKVPQDSWADNLRVHMGSELNNALREVIFPDPPEKKTYEEIVKHLTEFYTQTRNKYSEAIKFRLFIQNSDETISAYVRRLKVGAQYCEFGDFLDYSLTVQFIHGVKEDQIRDTIVLKKPEKFVDAVKIATDIETTKLASHDMKFKKEENVNKFAHASRPRKSCPSRSRHQSRSTSRSSAPWHRSRSNSRQNESQIAPPSRCFGCNGLHWRKDCKFLNAQCSKCSKFGHASEHCRQSRFLPGPSRSRTHRNTTHQTAEDDGCDFYDYSTVTYFHDVEDAINEVTESAPNIKRPPPAMITVLINNCPIKMELDTGGVCSMVNQNVLRQILPKAEILPSTRTFVSYTKDKFNCLGYVIVDVTLRGRTRSLNLYVTPFETDSIFGREWIAAFSDLLTFDEFFKVADSSKMPLKSILKPTATPTPSKIRLESILSKFKDLFSDSAGLLVGPPADVKFREDFKPVFASARQIPFALRKQYAAEIDKKIASGLYRQVSASQWASPTHIVMKGSKMRITGDYKSTLNPQIVVDEFPIPRVQELFHKIRGATKFSRLDITDAYMSLPCSEKFCEAMTLNTCTHGLIQPTRAQYGVASIPAIWQQRMELVLRGLNCAVNFFDDILVFANSEEQMLDALYQTFTQLHQAGLKLRSSKCEFMMDRIEFLGHTIDSSGLHCQDKHVDAIVKTSVPQNATELRTFLGKVTYYHSFIPNLSTVTAPLRHLLTLSKFHWTTEAKKAYNFLKTELSSDRVLTPYNPRLPLVLATDASPVGLGCVLSHIMEDGSERPIAFASKSLNETEKRYPQIDREALAIVWGVKRFFQYLYGRKFIIFTDNKPISHIFNPKTPLPQFTLSRCANYAAYLSNFNYDVKFKSSSQNSNADFLSRFPVNSSSAKRREATSSERDDFDEFVQLQIEQTPLTAVDIAKATKADSHLSAIMTALLDGRDLKLEGYNGREAEYSISEGCLMLGPRVVIPPKFRAQLLEELHVAHIGIVKMKGLARSLIYWPRIDEDIETMAKSCTACLKNAKMPAKFRSHHWEYPSAPWDRIHIDYAGPIHGKQLLIVVDAYSKWMSVTVTSSTTTTATCDILEGLFSQYGVPTVVVSDNAPQFSSENFKTFLRSQGVRFHKTSAVYHPSTNGQAERGVQTLKQALKTSEATPSKMQHCINEFLQQYHKAPHQTTGQPPSLLFLGRIIRSRLDLLRPNLQRRMTERQLINNSDFRSFVPGDLVMFRSYAQNSETWTPAVVKTVLGDLHYEVECDGRTFRRHVDQIRTRAPNKQSDQSKAESSPQPTDWTTIALANSPPRGSMVTRRTSGREVDDEPTPAPRSPGTPGDDIPRRRSASLGHASPKHTAAERRYPLRERKPRFKLDFDD
ncbi:unnamed protein product [Nesidiocoris tenuis]|uniref:RNA-directed DNA polymerase n=1 Tax=Nesidiocoris tenuis TaxID=355587 RepID=A0A6H5H946_9HEMI|nr:unnamed protein product [Nesidiocoris tenuis]